MKHRRAVYATVVCVAAVGTAALYAAAEGSKRSTEPPAAAAADGGEPAREEPLPSPGEEVEAVGRAEALRVFDDSAELVRSEATAVTMIKHSFVTDVQTGEWATVEYTTGAWSWDPPAVDATMDLTYAGEWAETLGVEGLGDGPRWLTLRVLDDVMYMERPDLADRFDGATWLKMDLRREADQDPEALDVVEHFNSEEGLAANPVETLGLAELCSVVDWVGEEPFGDIVVDVYRATADVADLMAEDTDLDEFGLTEKDLDALAREDAQDVLTMEVFIDKLGFPVWIDVTVHVGTQEMTLQSELFDYRAARGFTHPADHMIISDEEYDAAFPDGDSLNADFFDGWDDYEDYHLTTYGEYPFERYHRHEVLNDV